MKKGDVGMANASLIYSETRDELSTTCNPKVMSRFLSVPPYITASRTSAKTNMVSVVRIQDLVLCTVEEGVANTCIWLTMPAGKGLHLLDRKEMVWLQAS